MCDLWGLQAVFEEGQRGAGDQGGATQAIRVVAETCRMCSGLQRRKDLFA